MKFLSFWIKTINNYLECIGLVFKVRKRPILEDCLYSVALDWTQQALKSAKLHLLAFATPPSPLPLKFTFPKIVFILSLISSTVTLYSRAAPLDLWPDIFSCE